MGAHKINERQCKILRFVKYGLTGSKFIDQQYFQTGASPYQLKDEGNGSPKLQRLDQDIVFLRISIDEICPGLTELGLDGVRSLLVKKLAQVRSLEFRKGTKKVLRNLNAYFWDKYLEGHSNNRKRILVLADRLSMMVERAGLEVRNKILKQQARDRRRKTIGKLESMGLIRCFELPAEVHDQFGDQAYFLTQKGSDYYRSYISKTANAEYDVVRAYRFQVHSAVHEMLVSEVIRTLVSRQSKDNIAIRQLLDEPQLKKLNSSSGRRNKTITDLATEFWFQKKARNIVFLEIDNGSQPHQLFIERAKRYTPLIYICSSEKHAKSLHHYLCRSNEPTKDVFITTAEKFISGGIWRAGYLTKNKPEFCQCSQLVPAQVTNGRDVKDQFGCPCIFRYFTSSKELLEARPPKVSVKPAKPANVNEENLQTEVLPKTSKPSIRSANLKTKLIYYLWYWWPGIALIVGGIAIVTWLD